MIGDIFMCVWCMVHCTNSAYVDLWRMSSMINDAYVFIWRMTYMIGCVYICVCMCVLRWHKACIVDDTYLCDIWSNAIRDKWCVCMHDA